MLKGALHFCFVSPKATRHRRHAGGAVTDPSDTDQPHAARHRAGLRNMSNLRTCLMVMLGFHPASSLMIDKQILPLGYTLHAGDPV